MLKIGNAQAFWGDQPGAAAELVKLQPDIDYVTLDYLSEVSMSIMAIQKEKEPSKGYAKDFLDVIDSLIPFWKKGLRFKVVANAGGLNPQGCAEACKALLKQHACLKKIGILFGDNVLAFLRSEPENSLFSNLDNSQKLDTVLNNLVTANAYLGAEPVAELLKMGADIVITGRLADPSLTVGPCMAHFDWTSENYDKLAGATVAGHLIECGTQVTGGVCTNWLQVPDQVNIVFPFVEMDQDGSFTITKPHQTGGIVNIQTVKEQLLYEIGDPSTYLSPDCTVSFLNLFLKETGKDRINITGAIGKPPTASYKVSATYRNGYRADATLAIFGNNASEKAQRSGEIIIDRVAKAGFKLERTNIECFGNGAVVPGVFSKNNYPQSIECFLRIAASDHRIEALECFSKEIAAMVTSGPQGVTGYVSGRPRIRPVFGYWPCLIEKSKVAPIKKMLEPS